MRDVHPAVPGASPNNPTTSLRTSMTGKTDYRRAARSSFTSHLSVVEAVLKLFRSCVLLKRCVLAAPVLAFISLLPSRCSVLRPASVLCFAFLPSYQPQTAAALPVWTEINPNLLCVSVGAELPLLSRLQMHSSVIQSSAYSQL